MAVENITGNESIEELQHLMEVFEKRIKLLDDKKAATKPEIFQKVRGEYEAKLLEIQVLLEEKGAGMQEALDAALAEQGTLLAREKEIRNETEELELRAAIGEVEDNVYAQKTEAYNQELEAIVAKLQELAEKIDKYQALVGGKTVVSEVPEPPQPVVAPAPKPAPVPKPEPPAVPKPPKPEPPKATAVPKPAPIAPPPAPKPEPVAIQPSIPEPAPSAAPEPNPEAQRSELDELEKQFASILGSTFGQTPETAAPLPEPVSMEEPVAAEPEPVIEDIPLEESHEGELKCPKCGAFNRADNWYCEKCGNELINATDLLGGK